jgi:hypothetical protein
MMGAFRLGVTRETATEGTGVGGGAEEGWPRG